MSTCTTFQKGKQSRTRGCARLRNVTAHVTEKTFSWPNLTCISSDPGYSYTRVRTQMELQPRSLNQSAGKIHFYRVSTSARRDADDKLEGWIKQKTLAFKDLFSICLECYYWCSILFKSGLFRELSPIQKFAIAIVKVIRSFLDNRGERFYWFCEQLKIMNHDQSVVVCTVFYMPWTL